MRASRRNQEGYTLLEMMTTVLIIGILAAMAGPMVGATARERRKTQAMHDAIRLFHRVRARAIESGRAHLLRFAKTASGTGALYMVRGTTNTCRTSTFVTPDSSKCPTATVAGEPNLICTDWWRSTDYAPLGSAYQVRLLHTSGQSDPATASADEPDFCYDGMGILYWRLGTTGSFSDSPTLPGTGGSTLAGGGFNFSVTTVQDNENRGVIRRFVVPFGAEARAVQ